MLTYILLLGLVSLAVLLFALVTLVLFLRVRNARWRQDHRLQDWSGRWTEVRRVLAAPDSLAFLPGD